MKCKLCRKDVPGLAHVTEFSQKGIDICGVCYEEIDKNRDKPYSRVMDRLAIAEIGYRANRKKVAIYGRSVKEKDTGFVRYGQY